MERIQAGQINLSPIAALRPPPAARSRAQLYATGAIRGRPDMGWKAHATWHGLSSPWVWDGPYAPPSALRPLRSLLSKILPCVPCFPWAYPPPAALCPPPSRPTSAPFAPLCVQPSVIPPPVAFSTRTFPREKRFCQLQNNNPRPRSFDCYSPEFLRGP